MMMQLLLAGTRPAINRVHRSSYSGLFRRLLDAYFFGGSQYLFFLGYRILVFCIYLIFGIFAFRKY